MTEWDTFVIRINSNTILIRKKIIKLGSKGLVRE